MRHLLMLAAVAGLAAARPEVYREKEDFQYSRSSTDEGSKSGYYGAQRGNMGGNYERAHNMDPLAQNQMSGLVRTVEGELGDGAKQQTGSVYSSANSRGMYGSGNYDLRNLAGRNFQEGTSHGSQTHSSLASNHRSAYKGQLSELDQSRYETAYGSSQAQTSSYRQASDSRYGEYNTAENSAQVGHSGHGSSSMRSESEFDDRSLAQNSGYSQSAGYQGPDYDQGRSLSNGYASNIHSRLVSGTPVRIVVRPGTKVVLPVAAQTYDASQSSSAFNQNSETEVFNGNDQHELLKPENKHYESSYSYRKEWEKQDTRPAVVPLSIPTQNPYTRNSELYADTQAETSEQQRQSASRIASQNYQSQSHSRHNENSASSSQSRQADYSSYNGGIKGASNGAYNADASAAFNQIEDSNTKPKAYQSSYSYHKSWEHQGDPYVIKPATNGVYNDGQASGKLTAESLNQRAYGSHQYGSQRQTHQGYSSHSDVDCDEHGHVRVARSPGNHYHHQLPNRGDNGEDLGQQTEQQWDLHELGQQTQPQLDNLEALGQQTQNNWDQDGQQTENQWDKLRDEGQQTQTLWGQQEQQREWGKLEDIGQQKQQNQWDQQNFGQQSQNTWEKQELEPQRQTELGQQTQDTWTTMDTKSSGPGSSRQDNHSIDMDHQSNENTFGIPQQNHQTINTESHTLDTGTSQSSSHHAHTIWDEIKREEIGQENEDSVESNLTQSSDLGQQSQVTWGNINQNEDSFNPWHQKTEDKSQLDVTNSEQNNTFINTPNPHPWMYNHVHHHQDNRSYSNQYFSQNSSTNSFSGFNSHAWQEHSTNMNNNSFNAHAHTQSTGSIFGSSVMSLWDKLDNMEKQTVLSYITEDKVNQNVELQGTASVNGIPAQPNVFDNYTTATPQQPIITTSSTTSTPLNSDQVLPHDIGRGDIEAEVSSNSDDIGRGDIEPENSSNEGSKPVDLKPYKTLKDIETLSITKEANTVDKHEVVQGNSNTENDKDLSVLSLDQQNHSDSQDKKEQSVWQSGATVTSAVNSTQSNYHYINHKEHEHHRTNENENRNTEQKEENLDQQSLHQQPLPPHFVDYQKHEHANTDQNLFDFGQQSENVGPEQMEQQFEAQNIGHNENFQQENQKRETEELSQQNEQFDQVSLSGWKPDDNESQQEHKLLNWGQENLEQQSQFAGHEKNMEQQVQPAWKPTEDLQQHSELSDTFGPPMEDLSQQVQPAWKPEDLQQHSDLSDTFGPPIEDLSQQVQPAWNPRENSQQHSELSNTFAQPMEDLNQQVQTAWKPTEDSQQQSQLTDISSPQTNQNEELPLTLQKQPDIVEELIVPKKATVVDSPPTETVTEKPGFWKSIGTKFTSAKDKVSSWFS